MQYSIEEARAALQEKRFSDIKKRLKLTIHKQNVEDVSLLHLPYRILRECGDTFPTRGELWPSRYYPRHWSEIQPFNEWVSRRHPELAHLFPVGNEDAKDMDSTGKRMEFMFKDKAAGLDASNHTDAYKELLQQYEAEQMAFDGTPEGIEKRRYYTGRFLSGYDLDSFTEFDLFGSVGRTPQEIEQFRAECKHLQREFETHPEAFYTAFTPLPTRANDSLLPPDI